MTTTETTADKLRAEAAAAEQRAADSWERSDTDGFVTQWASDLTASEKRAQADILDNGGTAWFAALVDADTGEWVPSKLIYGFDGTCWAILGPDGRFTGEFVTAFPKREATMLRKGYREAQGRWPANARLTGTGTGLTIDVWVQTYKTCDDLTPPSEIVID